MTISNHSSEHIKDHDSHKGQLQAYEDMRQFLSAVRGNGHSPQHMLNDIDVFVGENIRQLNEIVDQKP